MLAEYSNMNIHCGIYVRYSLFNIQEMLCLENTEGIFKYGIFQKKSIQCRIYERYSCKNILF